MTLTMFSLNSITFLFLLICAPFCAFAEKALNPSELEMGPLIRYDAPEEATASIILLHGLGGTGDMFKPLVERLHNQTRFKHINFVLPTAPLRETPFHVQYGSLVTHSWFNFSVNGSNDWMDSNHFWQISDYIERLVENETAHGMPQHRIVVGGFSQGGMVATGGLASIHTKVGGWLLFPTKLPSTVTSFYPTFNPTNRHTAVFHGHGFNDTMVYVQEAVGTANFFKELGYDYHLHLYPGMVHQIDWEANDKDVEAWIEKTIPKWRK